MRSDLFADTIVNRIALTIFATVMTAALLYVTVIATIGVRGRPSLNNTGLLDQAAIAIRVVSHVSDTTRSDIATALSNKDYTVHWDPNPCELEHTFRNSSRTQKIRRLAGNSFKDAFFYAALLTHGKSAPDPVFRTAAFGLAVSFYDRSCLVFAAPQRVWGFNEWKRAALLAFAMILTTVGGSWLAARTLVRPIKAFSMAADRFARDKAAPAMLEIGSRELRQAARAFNNMQADISQFMKDRTMMLAAISHDLRTPLTRVRLRAEFIRDPHQRQRLVDDVVEMQTMIDAALSLFRDDTQEEQATHFDMAELIRTIADDAADQNRRVVFEDEDPCIFYGKPVACRRAIENIILNACMYGTYAKVELTRGAAHLLISVIDDGPGIPPSMQDKVFDPFFRIEASRNRKTGGSGIGLTSARTIIQAHGGTITLHNLHERGLCVKVLMPIQLA